MVLVEKRDVEGAGEVLSEVVAGCSLQGPPVTHQRLAGEGLHGPCETLGGALRAGEHGDRHRLVETVPVDVQHLQGLLAGLLGGGVDGVALLPEKLRGAQEWARDLLPAKDVAPLVDQDGQVAVALDPVPVEVTDDALRRRPDRQRLLELLPAPYRHPGQLRVEALDVLCLFPQEALGDQQGKVRVMVPGGLEAVVEVALGALPDGEPVGPYGKRAPHRPVVGQLRHPDELQVPPARILALFGKLLDSLDHWCAPLSMRA